MAGISCALSVLVFALVCAEYKQLKNWMVLRISLCSFFWSVGTLIPAFIGFEKTWCKNPYTYNDSGVCTVQGMKNHARLSLIAPFFPWFL
jgi:hypothetical protein